MKFGFDLELAIIMHLLEQGMGEKDMLSLNSKWRMLSPRLIFLPASSATPVAEVLSDCIFTAVVENSVNMLITLNV